MNSWYSVVEGTSSLSSILVVVAEAVEFLRFNFCVVVRWVVVDVVEELLTSWKLVTFLSSVDGSTAPVSTAGLLVSIVGKCCWK